MDSLEAQVQDAGVAALEAKNVLLNRMAQVENAILDSAAPSVDPNAYAEFEGQYSAEAEDGNGAANEGSSDETRYHAENDVEGQLSLSGKATTKQILEARCMPLKQQWIRWMR